MTAPLVVERVPAFSEALDRARAAGRTVGLVPTMGALHRGHRSLVERAAAECDDVAVTIFVNPIQFGQAEDLDAYPRTIEADLHLCAAAGATIVLVPSVAEMYPVLPVPTTVTVRGLTEAWEGARRPGHFDGVCTLVAKLFAMAGRCRAYFGEKDFQQLAVVRRLTADLSFPVEVVGCPTVRDPDGVALSSRIARLSDDERAAAAVLPRALLAGRSAVERGTQDPAVVVAAMTEVCAGQPGVDLEYASAVDPTTLAVPAQLGDAAVRLLLAARVGAVRLIDNVAAQRVPAGRTDQVAAGVGGGRG